MASVFDKLVRELKFKLNDTTLVSDVNQTLSNLLSQTNKVKTTVATVNTKAQAALVRSTNPTLSLEQLSDVSVAGLQNGQTITWNGTNWVNTSTGIPSGTNVWKTGYGGLSSSNPTAIVVGGSSCIQMLPGRSSLCMPASWKFTIKSDSGGTVKLTKAVVAICNMDSLTVNSFTNVLFSGSAAVNFTTTATSDTINIQIDVDHDYYIIMFFDASSANLHMWQNQEMVFTVGTVVQSGDKTATSPITTTGGGNRSFFTKIVVA